MFVGRGSHEMERVGRHPGRDRLVDLYIIHVGQVWCMRVVTYYTCVTSM